jgi:hypothetical protein
LPESVVKTTWLDAPAACGNFASSRSIAFCDSVPGIEKSCGALPLYEPMIAPTTTIVRTRPARPRFQWVASERAMAASNEDMAQTYHGCKLALVAIV